MRSFLLSLMLLVFLAGCTNNDSPNVFGDLYGMVVEENTGTAVQNVAITLTPGGYSTVTGTDGRYEFVNLECQQYTVSAYKNGYQSDYKTVTVLPDQSVTCDFMIITGSSSLYANPTTLDFGDSKTQMVFDINNESSVSTVFTVTSPSGSWCSSISPLTGTLQANNGSQGITVTIDRSKLTADVSENIIITADNGGSATVEISISLESSSSSSSDSGTDTSTIEVTNGLWAYYTFDNEDMNDMWENEMNGNFDYTPKFTTSTPNGDGKSLMIGLNNSNQWVKARIPYNPFSGKTEYSYSFWVKNPTQGLLMNAYGYNTSSSSSNYPTMRIANDKLYAAFESYSTSDYFDYNPSTVIQDGNWNHIAVSVKDNEQILYINGVRTSTQQSNVDSSKSTEIHFGGTLDSYTGAEMVIDNIRIYTRTISQTDAYNIYISEKY